MNNPERDLDIKKLSPAATVISAAGLGLVIKGSLAINTLRGVLEIGAGRSLDALDGATARALDQSSDVGAIVDAGFDKTGIGIVSMAAWRQKAIPKPVIAGIAAKNAISAGLTYIHGKRHPNESFRPTHWGKASMGADSISYGAHLLASALETDRPDLPKQQKIARYIGHAATAASVVTGVVSLAQYTHRTFFK